MNASVSVVCYKSKVLSNGKSPLMLRVTKDRKPKYVSLGIAIFPKYWDFEKNKPTPRCPNKELIEKIMIVSPKVCKSFLFSSLQIYSFLIK